jgi:hypothetical protein
VNRFDWRLNVIEQELQPQSDVRIHYSDEFEDGTKMSKHAILMARNCSRALFCVSE